MFYRINVCARRFRGGNSIVILIGHGALPHGLKIRILNFGGMYEKEKRTNRHGANGRAGSGSGPDFDGVSSNYG